MSISWLALVLFASQGTSAIHGVEAAIRYHAMNTIRSRLLRTEVSGVHIFIEMEQNTLAEPCAVGTH